MRVPVAVRRLANCYTPFTFTFTFIVFRNDFGRKQRCVCVHITAVTDAPSGHITLGANMANGIEQKGIDTLQQCIKKCAGAGLGIPATVRVACYRLV